MIINLQYNSSEENVINKSIITRTSIEGVFKESTNVITPTFILEINYSYLRQYINYFEIPDFDRAYFITNVRVIGSNTIDDRTIDIVELTGKVDVLESFKNGILEQEAYIERQENLYNLYLPDTYVAVESGIKSIYKEFPYGLTEEELVLIVAGNSTRLIGT